MKTTSSFSPTTPPVSVQDLSKPVRSNGGDNGKPHRRRHARFRNGCRLAALRGYAGAKLVLDKGVDPVEAAVMTGSCPGYVCALAAVLKNGDATLLNAVLEGRVPVMAAAAQVRALAKLLTAYMTASATTKVAFGSIVGTDRLFDEVVAPAMAAAAE
jgi:hypothetical protein